MLSYVLEASNLESLQVHGFRFLDDEDEMQYFCNSLSNHKKLRMLGYQRTEGLVSDDPTMTALFEVALRENKSLSTLDFGSNVLVSLEDLSVLESFCSNQRKNPKVILQEKSRPFFKDENLKSYPKLKELYSSVIQYKTA